jgi:hypothetical protein
MKNFILIGLLISSISAFGSDTTSRISFVNATKNDNLIILCKIMSYPKFDSTKEVCPEKMIVEVLEVLKGKNSSKLITVLGYDKSVNNNLACLQFYSIGRYYILGLDNFKLIATGNHSLEYNEGTVKGNITNEPTREYLKKFQKIFDRLQKEEFKKTIDKEKIEKLRKEFTMQSDLLNQSMDYKSFKETFTFE